MNEMEKALRFCRDIASEEYQYQQNNVGAEAALRHIIKKCDEVIANKAINTDGLPQGKCVQCGYEHPGINCSDFQ